MAHPTHKFTVAPNGADAFTKFSTDEYQVAQDWARENSHGDGLGWNIGMAVWGPSGRITTYLDGEKTGHLVDSYQDENTGEWVQARRWLTS